MQADCSGHSMQLLPVKNLIRGEDVVGCSVRGVESASFVDMPGERIQRVLFFYMDYDHLLTGMRSWRMHV